MYSYKQRNLKKKKKKLMREDKEDLDGVWKERTKSREMGIDTLSASPLSFFVALARSIR